MTPEGKVVADIKAYVKEQGGDVRKAEWVGHSGCPDLFIMFKDRHFWLEVKRVGGKVSPVQAREIARMLGAGCPVEVVFGFDQARKVIDELRG